MSSQSSLPSASAAPPSLPDVADTIHAPSPHQDYAHLIQLLRTVTEAPNGTKALERVFSYLRLRLQATALLVERVDGARIEMQPFGDVAAILALNLSSSANACPELVTISLHVGTDDYGKIHYLFASGAVADRPMLEAVTSQIVLRLANDKLAAHAHDSEEYAKRRIREVATLYDIGRALPPVPIPQLLQLIVDRTAVLMDAQTCSVMLLDEERDRLRIAASHGLPRDLSAHTQYLGEGIAGRVAQTDQPLLLTERVQKDPRLVGLVLQPDSGSAMLVPMKDQTNQVLGVLSIRRCPPAVEFTQEDLKLFTVFATQAGLALTNMRLYEDLNRRASELLKLSTLSRALLSTIDLDALLRTAVDDVCTVVGFDRCCLYLRDKSSSVLVPRLVRGYAESLRRNPVKLGEGAVGWVARSKTMLLYNSQVSVTLEQEQQRPYPQMKGFARSLGTNSFVAIPILTSKDTCIGVIVADNKSKRAPVTSEQKNLLQAFVSQAGIAIENALLYEQTQDNVTNLRRLKDYTDNVIQSIQAAILTTDGRGYIVRWNRAAEETLHLSAREFREVPLTILIGRMHLPDEEREQLLRLLSHVQETGERVHRLKMTLHPQGRAPMTVYLMISRLPEHRSETQRQSMAERGGIVLIMEDVTQEVRLEAELEKMRRLADIGQLAAKMAHEVRNALSPIKGAAQIIRSEMQQWQEEEGGGDGRTAAKEDEGAQASSPESASLRSEQSSHASLSSSLGLEWPDMIIAEVEGLSRLTSEMLDFARPTRLDLRTVHINQFLQTALLSLTPFLREHSVEVLWRLEPDLPTIQADEAQLGQVARNLVMNAAQSMAEGGTIEIRTHFDSTGELVVIHVIDAGTGILPQDLERIFQPFVTTRPKGTGLGLPIVQKIVDHHGGYVEVESEVGKGTHFQIFLPLSPPQEGLDTGREESPLIYSRQTGKFPDK